MMTSRKVNTNNSVMIETKILGIFFDFDLYIFLVPLFHSYIFTPFFFSYIKKCKELFQRFMNN